MARFYSWTGYSKYNKEEKYSQTAIANNEQELKEFLQRKGIVVKSIRFKNRTKFLNEYHKEDRKDVLKEALASLRKRQHYTSRLPEDDMWRH